LLLRSAEIKPYVPKICSIEHLPPLSNSWVGIIQIYITV